MIQRVIIFSVVVFFAYACASSKKAVDVSVGEWEYVLKNLPDGDAEGTFTIAKEGDKYIGAVHGEQGSMDLENVVIENDELVSTFDYQGYTVNMTGTFVGDTFTGMCTVEDYELPMTAVRKQ